MAEKVSNKQQNEKSINDYFSVRDIRIDGIPNIFASSFVIVQAMWVVLFLCFSGFCGFLLYSTFLEYLEYPVITTNRLITQSKLTFPTISFYNMNPLNTYYYADLLFQTNITTQLFDTATTTGFDPLVAYNNFVQLEYTNKLKCGRYFNSTEKKALFDMDGFIISCTFQNKPCNMSNFRYLYNPFLLSAVQFNSGYDSDGNAVELLEADVAGSYNELTIEFYVGLPNPLVDLISARGVSIFLHNNTEYPFKNSPSPLVLTPGFGLTATLQRTSYRQFNEWPFTYSSCTVNGNTVLRPLNETFLFNSTLATGYTYSRDTCLLFCFQLYNT
jgi:hypothetical protein